VAGHSNPRVPNNLEKVEDCKFDNLPPLKFRDTKTGKLLEEKYSDVVDYVPNMNPRIAPAVTHP
jgi:hypothetical protein